MRPWSSSSVRMLGMLDSTLVWRRLDQNPGVMVTAWTGTLFSLAKGELRVAIMPALAQSGSRVGVLDGVLDCPKAKSLVGSAAEAVAAAAVVMNWRRVTDEPKFMDQSL